MNKDFNETSFSQLLVYGNTLLEMLGGQSVEFAGLLDVYITILHFLKKWFKVKQIRKHLFTTVGRISTCLRRFQMHYEVFIKHTMNFVRMNPFLI